MKKLVSLLTLLASFSAFAGSPIYWGPGNKATVIPPILVVGAIQYNGGGSTAPQTTTWTSPTSVTGTLTNSAGGTAVTGTGTKFRTEFHVGDTITMNAETRTIASIATDTSLVTDTWTGANTGATATRAAVADAYIYPNGNIQSGGTRATYTALAGSTYKYRLILASTAPTAGSTNTDQAAAALISYAGAGTVSSQFALITAMGTEALPSAVQSTKSLGVFDFRGHDGTDANNTSARIQGLATENYSATAHGGKMVLQVVPNTTTTLTTSLTLDQDLSISGAATGTINVGGARLLEVTHGTTQTTFVHLQNTGGQISFGLDDSAGAQFGTGGYNGIIYTNGIGIYIKPNGNPGLALNTGGDVASQSTTASTTSTTGALTTAGGMGVAKSLFVGGDLGVGGVNGSVAGLTKIDTTATVSVPINGASYVFTVTAANATVGATYTNNGSTFTVFATIAGTTTLKAQSSTGAPAASGTLTKTSGTGDATITFSSQTTANQDGGSTTFAVGSGADGLIFIDDTADGKSVLVMMTGGGATLTIVSDPSSVWSTAANTASKKCLTVSNGTLTLQNNNSLVPHNFHVTAVRGG